VYKLLLVCAFGAVLCVELSLSQIRPLSCTCRRRGWHGAGLVAPGLSTQNTRKDLKSWKTTDLLVAEQTPPEVGQGLLLITRCVFPMFTALHNTRVRPHMTV
jgi:hypothetical protein